MQLSDKDKQALQEKYRKQRQAMWAGKQSTTQEAEKQTAQPDQGDATDIPTDSTDTTLLGAPADPSSTAVDQSTSIDKMDEEASQSESSIQPEPETSAQRVDPTYTARETEEGEEQAQATEGERVFWETEEQEGGPIPLTWKIVLAVIGVAIVLIGVGVWLGFLFAG